MIPSSPLLPSTPAPVRGRGAVRAFGASLLILSEKQRFVRGLDYLAVQHICGGIEQVGVIVVALNSGGGEAAWR